MMECSFCGSELEVCGDGAWCAQCRVWAQGESLAKSAPSEEHPIEVTCDGEMHPLVSQVEAGEMERLFNNGQSLDVAELDRMASFVDGR